MMTLVGNCVLIQAEGDNDLGRALLEQIDFSALAALGL